MEEALRRIDALTEKNEFNYEADFNSHLLIVDAGCNTFFSSAMRLIEDQTKFGMSLSDYFASQKSRPRIHQMQIGHIAILDAIRSGDSARARAAMSDHLMSSRRRILGDKSAMNEPEQPRSQGASDGASQEGPPVAPPWTPSDDHQTGGASRRRTGKTRRSRRHGG